MSIFLGALWSVGHPRSKYYSQFCISFLVGKSIFYFEKLIYLYLILINIKITFCSYTGVAKTIPKYVKTPITLVNFHKL